RLRATALALRDLRLRATALALRDLRLRAKLEVSRCGAHASRALALAASVVFFLLANVSVFVQAAQGPLEGKPNFSGLWGGGGANAGAAPNAAGGQRGSNISPVLLTRRQQGLADLPLSEWGRQVFLYYTAADGKFQGETGGVADPRYHSGVCG